MVYDSRRDYVHLEVRDLVRAYHHRAVLGVEGVHELLEGCAVVIDIVGIQLDCKAAALGMVDGGVPVAPYRVVRRVLRYIHKARIVLEGKDLIHGAVSGVVVHYYYIIRKRSLLGQGRCYCLPYGAHPVLAGDDHGGLVLEVAFPEVHRGELRRQPGAYRLEVVRAGGFHLYLHLAVAGIHVVELLLPGLAVIGFHFVIEELPYVDKVPDAREAEAQVVESRIFICGLRHSRRSLFQRRHAHQQDGAEVEIVPEGTALAVYYGRFR